MWHAVPSPPSGQEEDGAGDGDRTRDMQLQDRCVRVEAELHARAGRTTGPDGNGARRSQPVQGDHWETNVSSGSRFSGPTCPTGGFQSPWQTAPAPPTGVKPLGTTIAPELPQYSVLKPRWTVSVMVAPTLLGGVRATRSHFVGQFVRSKFVLPPISAPTRLSSRSCPPSEVAALKTDRIEPRARQAGNFEVGTMQITDSQLQAAEVGTGQNRFREVCEEHLNVAQVRPGKVGVREVNALSWLLARSAPDRSAVARLNFAGSPGLGAVISFEFARNRTTRPFRAPSS